MTEIHISPSGTLTTRFRGYDENEVSLFETDLKTLREHALKKNDILRLEKYENRIKELKGRLTFGGDPFLPSLDVRQSFNALEPLRCSIEGREYVRKIHRNIPDPTVDYYCENMSYAFAEMYPELMVPPSIPEIKESDEFNRYKLIYDIKMADRRR